MPEEALCFQPLGENKPRQGSVWGGNSEKHPFLFLKPSWGPKIISTQRFMQSHPLILWFPGMCEVPPCLDIDQLRHTSLGAPEDHGDLGGCPGI